MKKFETGRKYRIPENCWGYAENGTFVLLSRTAEQKVRVRKNGSSYNFLRWPAMVNGKKTWVDIAEDKDLDCESFHEISGTTGEWKKNTCRIHLQG